MDITWVDLRHYDPLIVAKLCLSWLLSSRVRKFRRYLWITLYIELTVINIPTYIYIFDFSKPYLRATASLSSIL
jgi:hypothetical protein